MRVPALQLTRARVGVLLFGLALAPTLLFGLLAGRQLDRSNAEQQQLSELDDAADRLVQVVTVEGALIDEIYWRQARIGVGKTDMPPSLITAFDDLDFENKERRARRIVDEQLDGPLWPQIRVLLEQARAPDLDAQTASERASVVSAALRQEVIVSAETVIRLSARLDDGDHLVTAARTLKRSTQLRNALADLSSNSVDQRLGIAAEPSNVRNGALRARVLYDERWLALDRLVTADTMDTGEARTVTAWERLAADRESAELLALAGGSAPTIDRDGSLAAMSDLAAFLTLAAAVSDTHLELIDAAAADLADLVDRDRADAAYESWLVALSTLAAAAIAISSTLVVTRAIVNPLKDLAAAAEAIRSGDGTDEIPARGPREIRSATVALNEAMSNIQRTEDQALALADGRFDDPILEEPVAGRIGRSVQSAVEQLRSSLAEREEYRRRLAHEAAHDGLTGLPNRTASMNHLDQALARAQRSGHLMALLFVDLDGFKQVNDLHGHPVGDHLLQEIARRLTSLCREGDLVGRIGGDEFVIIAEPVAGAAESIELAERLRSAVAQPIEGSIGTFSPNASIGVAIADGNLTADELLRDADLAVYQAKQLGRGRTELCDDELRGRLAEESTLEQALRRALDHDEFVLHFQVTVDAITKDLNGLEALLRWNRNGKGIVLPDRFVAFAERSDLILEIDRWVIDRALEHLATWSDHPILGRLPLAINISGRHLMAADLLADIEDGFDRWKVAPERLTVEITENALLDDMVVAGQPLIALRERGVRIAMDDFGTGYTSLSHLRSLPVDVLKIDRSFTAHIDQHDDLSLVRLIIDTGRLLGLDITAEGVETSEQARTLTDLGVDTLQGYLFGQPMSTDRLQRRLDALVRTS